MKDPGSTDTSDGHQVAQNPSLISKNVMKASMIHSNKITISRIFKNNESSYDYSGN